MWSAHIEAAAYFHFGRDANVCVVLLYLLLGLQVYWFALILKVRPRPLYPRPGTLDPKHQTLYPEP